MNHYAGEPIKDRGIKWTENYGDKSAYLKEEFEAQVGPGSYFRWEGHDFTTGTDYYVVVTPGYSKKHGYHFFAGLRKEPAENGASGKHFSTQGEALSYAIDKWNIPRPQTAPHKPYVAKDLEGKQIVTENVHASSSTTIRVSGKDGSMIIIDATDDQPIERTAMALHSMKPRFHAQYGKNTYPAICQNAARASSIMGLRAAMRTKLEFVTMDANNWDDGTKGTDDTRGASGVGLPDSPHMATCEDINPTEFDAIVNRDGLSVRNQLFEFSRSGGLKLTPPSGTPNDNYSVVRFSNVSNISAKIKVPFDKKNEFDMFLASFADRSDLNGGRVVCGPVPRGEKKKSLDYEYDAAIPIDLLKRFQDGTKAMASVKPSQNFNVQNAIRMYNYYDKAGQTATPEDKHRIMQTPMFEEYKGIKGGHALTFDKRGVPLGIDVAKSRRVGMEGKNQKAHMFVLKKSVTDGWNQQYDGDWGRVKDALFSGEIPLDAGMFVDSRTCAPKMMPVYSLMPKVGVDLMPETENGVLVNEVRNVVPEYSISATNGVRVFNPQTNKMHYMRVPDGVEPQQDFNSMAVVMGSSKNYIPVQANDGRTELREVDGGEWSMMDSESYGKFVPGKCYRFGITPKNASPKKTDVKLMHGLGLNRGGWGIYTSDVYANMEWHDGPPKDLDERAAAQEIVTDASGQVVGYYGCVQRQYGNDPFSTSMPTEKKPIEIPLSEQDANGNVIGTDRMFTLTPEDAYKESDADGLIINSLPKAVKYLQATFGLADNAFGPIPDVDERDLATIDEKVKAAMAKSEAVRAGRLDESALEPWEAMLHKFPKGSNIVPPDFYSALVEAESDPSSWEPKTGPMYGVFDLNAGSFIEGEEFATEEKATSFKDFVSSSQPAGEASQFEVRITRENAPLTASFRDRLEEDPHAEFVSNKDAFEGMDDLDDVVGTGGEQPVDGEVAPEGGETAPAEPTEPTDVPMDDPASHVDSPLESDVPPASMKLPPIIHPRRMPKPQPAPVPVTVPDAEATALGRLVKLADRFDEEGRAEESLAVDKLIKRLSEKFARALPWKSS